MLRPFDRDSPERCGKIAFSRVSRDKCIKGIIVNLPASEHFLIYLARVGGGNYG